MRCGRPAMSCCRAPSATASRRRSSRRCSPAAGCWLRGQEALHRRLPPVVRAASDQVDPTYPETATGLLAAGPATVDALAVNAALRARSDDAMHRVLARAGG